MKTSFGKMKNKMLYGYEKHWKGATTTSIKEKF